jgi:hypothetical protein
MKDPTLGRQWFWIKTCGDSQRPAQLLWAPLSLEKEKAYAKPTSAEEDHLLVLPRDNKEDHLLVLPRDKKEDHFLVHSGDDVVVTQTTGVFSMRLAGHALQAGELGSNVRVEVHTWNSTTILTGKISGKDEVRVGS